MLNFNYFAIETVVKKIKAKAKKYAFFMLFLYAVVISLYLTFSYFFRPVVVSGSSMLPTLNNDEMVFIEKVESIGDIKRGDIIVFKSPYNSGELLIKRVIGVEGDRVAIEDGKVYLNGKLLYEPYRNKVKSHETIPLVVVPRGCFYVLGDNRVVSSDSREFGFVPFERIYGKLVFKPKE